MWITDHQNPICTFKLQWFGLISGAFVKHVFSQGLAKQFPKRLTIMVVVLGVCGFQVKLEFTFEGPLRRRFGLFRFGSVRLI